MNSRCRDEEMLQACQVDHVPGCVQVIRLLIAISMLGLASNAKSSATILARRFQMPARCTRVEVGKKSTARSWLLQMLMVWLVLTCLAQRNATRRSAHLIASCLSGEAGVHSEGGVQSYTRSLLTKPKKGGFSCNTNVPFTCGSGLSQSKTSSRVL